MSERSASITVRQVTVARLYGIAADHAGGHREGLTRQLALAELAGACTDPDLLAEAAAAHAVAANWFAITAVDLLIEAGADRRVIDRHVDEGGSGAQDSCEQSHDLG